MCFIAWITMTESMNKKTGMALNLHPQDYDYLWTDHDVNFIFTSCYLFKEFRDADIVLLYDLKQKGLQFFLAKKERVRFSEYGVEFFEKHFEKWKKEILGNIEEGKQLAHATDKERLRIHLLNKQDLRKRISRRVHLFQALGGNYFFTEFFFLDKVEKMPEFKAALEEMGKLKYQARAVLNEYYNYPQVFGPYVDEAGKRMKRDDMQWLSYQEIIDLLDGKKVEASRRDSTNWVLAKKTGWKLVEGKEADDCLAMFQSHFFSKKVDLIKGVIANKGIYTGKVKIVRTLFSDKITDELVKVEKGDVLVAETTGPEMIVACKKAGAIVTDEGGLTSHAAIVSRELGIPCIVGAKIATKVFKDGDNIEVDAKNGVIRKIP